MVLYNVEYQVIEEFTNDDLNQNPKIFYRLITDPKFNIFACVRRSFEHFPYIARLLAPHRGYFEYIPVFKNTLMPSYNANKIISDDKLNWTGFINDIEPILKKEGYYDDDENSQSFIKNELENEYPSLARHFFINKQKPLTVEQKKDLLHWPNGTPFEKFYLGKYERDVLLKKEDPKERAKCLLNRRIELKKQGVKNFIKKIADEQNLSESRVKQLISKAEKEVKK